MEKRVEQALIILIFAMFTLGGILATMTAAGALEPDNLARMNRAVCALASSTRVTPAICQAPAPRTSPTRP